MATDRTRAVPAIVAVWVLSGIYLVAPDQQAVETLFGKVVAPRVLPGLHYALPWPIESVTKLKVRQLQRLVVGGDLPDSVLGRTQPLPSQFLTGDQNIINMRVVVQYSVGVPADYLFQAQDPAQAGGRGGGSGDGAPHRPPRRGCGADHGESWPSRTRCGRPRRSVSNDYRAGVLLSTINIESVTPPPEAADAFRDVASARADTARIVSDAEGYANDLIPKARGQAQQMLEEAEAYQQKKINEAAGDAARFTQIAAEYAKAVAGDRPAALPGDHGAGSATIRKLIVDRNGNLDLTIIRKGDPGTVK